MPLPQYNETEESGMAGGSAVPEEAAAPEPQAPEGGENEHTMFISPEHLGGLDPSSVNPGDILEFKVVGRDADGDIEVEYNKGEGGKDGSKMDKMKSEFSDHMEAAPAAPEGGGY